MITGDTQAATRGLDTVKLTLVPLDEIVVDDTFNIRIKDEEYEEHVETLKHSIINNGYSNHLPVTGRVIRLNGADVIQLTGGFQRYEAACRAQHEGHPIDTIPVGLHPPGTSETDLIVALVNDNSGRPLRYAERAQACERLRDQGLADIEIARRLGISPGYVSSLFTFSALPDPLKQLVVEKGVPGQWAVQKSRQLGPDATLELVQQVEAPHPHRKRQNQLPGEISRAQALTAIRYAVEHQDIEWLTSFERGDDAPMTQVKQIIQKGRKRRMDL